MSKAPMVQPVVYSSDGQQITSSSLPKNHREGEMVHHSSSLVRNAFDRNNTQLKSALAMLPEEVQAVIDNHIFTSPDVFKMGEREIIKKITNMGYAVSATDTILRQRLWIAYDRAILTGKEVITYEDLLEGVCTENFFKEKFLRSQYLCALLLTPPISFKAKQEEALLFGLDRLREVLELPSVDHLGRVDTKIIRAQLAVYNILEKRVLGETVQKIAHAHAMIPLEPLAQTELRDFSEEELLKKVQAMAERQRARERNNEAISFNPSEWVDDTDKGP